MMIKRYKIIKTLSIIGSLIFYQSLHAADNNIPYHIEFIGIEDTVLKEELLSYSIAQKQQDSPPSSLFALKQRAKKDLPLFIKLLHSKAYFNAKVSVESEQQEEQTALIFHINLGQQYRLQQVNIQQNTDSLEKPTLKQLALELEKPALTSVILEAEQRLLNYAKNQSYAFATLCPRKVVVNHDLYTVNVDFCLTTGQQVLLGNVSFNGNDHVDADFLKNLIQWQQGSLYNQRTLDNQRLRLVDSRLFTVARLHLATEADDNGHFPVTFELTERLPRTISAGLRLTTDEELFLLRFAWEHRNLWQHGETIDAELNISVIKSSLEGSFRKPVFYGSKNTLVLDSALTREDTDAYKSLRAELSAAIDHQFSHKKRLNAGIAYQFSRITEQNNRTENFNLVSLPLGFNWDFSNNFLEPSAGGRLWIDQQPFLDISSGASFHKQKIRYNHYFSLLDSDDLILAGRMIIGNIWGAKIDDIPADLRYFAGGGDTVRGYSFQSLSPKDEDNQLIGGRSLLSLSVELRGWITETIGLVGFIDSGRAYDNVYQDLSELRTGAGLGLRYKTPIGALRLDLARAVNKREEDDEFQVYVSIGHTF